MYARFYRWASDRLGDEGLVAFVTNSSFLEAKTFDGFRKLVAGDFSEAWVVDLKGNARTSGQRRQREGGNIFEDKIKVGIAIAFFVRRRDRGAFRVHYLAVDDYLREDDKREFVARRDLSVDRFTTIKPTPDGQWLNQTDDSQWKTYLPLASKSTKSDEQRHARALFHLFGNGVNTARDSWVVDSSASALELKARTFLKRYDRVTPDSTQYPKDIKWSRNLKLKSKRGQKEPFSYRRVARYSYRPFSPAYAYLSSLLVDELGAENTFGSGINTRLAISAGLDFRALATKLPTDFHLLGETRILARFRYSNSGERIDNITDWALEKLVKEYGIKAVSKDGIFNYIYAVLHDPAYRETFGLHLKREFPRIPLYPEFARWAAWGEALAAMHAGYEDVAPWPVKRTDLAEKGAKGTHPKPILRSQPDLGLVIIDADTQITGIPPEAWTYRLGSRAAIDWVLDQHKEKKLRDGTVDPGLNTYCFSDYKESMITLLSKVVRVSVDTVRITTAMRAADHGS